MIMIHTILLLLIITNYADLGQQTKDEWNKIKFVSNPEKVEDLTKQVIENETNTAWVGEVKDFQNPWDVELNENQKPDTVKETPSELDKEFIAKFNNDFNQNNHDEQSAWDSTYLYGLPNQEQSDYMGQEAQSTWGVLEFLDQHKTGSVSEKTDDKLGNLPIQGKISEENSSFSYFDHSYTETVNESNNNFHGEFTSNKKTEDWSNTGYTYKDQTQGSLSSLWNKITNDDKSSVVETTTYQSDIVVPIEQSKNNSSNWGQEVYGFEDSSNFAAHQLWLTKILNETRTSTVRTTTPTTKVASTTSMTIPTSTTKPIIKSTTMSINEDIGRGDIGPEEIIPEITTEKVKSTFAINNYKNENTGSHNVIGLSAGNNESQSELKTDQSDSTLNVISLNKWLQRNQEEEMQLNNIGISVTTSTLTPLKTTKASYSLSSATQEIQNTYLNNNSHIILDNNEDQHIQTSEDIEHQNIHQENQQIYESSDQQSETVWGQSLEDYLREPTTQDKPQLAENFGMTQRENQNFDRIYQEADTQQVEHFEIVQQSKRDSFYNETKSLPSYQQQNSQKDVQPTEKVENKTMPTEKPGFWKSVGNKFSNAKDKVSSWFRRS